MYRDVTLVDEVFVVDLLSVCWWNKAKYTTSVSAVNGRRNYASFI